MDSQASSSLGSRPDAQDSQSAKQALEALNKEQKVLKKQLVDHQRAEATHLQTISEVCVLRLCLAHRDSSTAYWT